MKRATHHPNGVKVGRPVRCSNELLSRCINSRSILGAFAGLTVARPHADALTRLAHVQRSENHRRSRCWGGPRTALRDLGRKRQSTAEIHPHGVRQCGSSRGMSGEHQRRAAPGAMMATPCSLSGQPARLVCSFVSYRAMGGCLNRSTRSGTRPVTGRETTKCLS